MTDRPLPDDAADIPKVPAELIERMAAPLRAPVTLDEEFEGRVMRAVRRSAASEGAPRARRWWQRSYTVELTPISGLAVAASLAVVAVLGGVTARRAAGSVAAVTAAAATPRQDTVYVVRFTFVHPDAQRVSLVGDFNGWTPGATPLAGQGVDGVWSASVPIAAGRHEYAFIVDGRRWVADPYAATVHDEFGTSSSVVQVGDA